MSTTFRGIAARLHSFATGRISLLRDLSSTVADEVLKKVTVGTVMDVGTGPGHLTIKIGVKNPSLEIVGLDLSRDMIKIARQNAEERSANNVQFPVGDIAEIGLQDETVDLAVATLSFHHWTNTVKAFEELSRILKSAGEVWIYEVDNDLTAQSREWMKNNYNIITRKIAHLATRHLSGHSITVDHAKEILEQQMHLFSHGKVEQLTPMLVKITLTKKK
jgi:ubiquinone/menaquinone biosynthesis C-methylase UbiE